MKKNKYSLLNFIPLNLETEKEKFFAENGKYNPQFIYNRQFDNSYLNFWGLPDKKKVAIIEKKLMSGKLSLPKKPIGEEKLTDLEIKQRVADLVDQLGLPKLEVVFKKNLSSRFLLQTDNYSLFVRQDSKITLTELNKVLNHEIQTHYLRGYNETLQPWAKKRLLARKLWLRTEEGLAIINSHSENAPENDFFFSYMRYYLVGLAQKYDFATTYKIAKKYLLTDQRAWLMTMRAKRGLEDTSQKGGYTKDIVYLEGLEQVRAWLKNPENKMADLYWGRIGTQEVEELRNTAKMEGVLLPTWLRENSDLSN